MGFAHQVQRIGLRDFGLGSIFHEVPFQIPAYRIDALSYDVTVSRANSLSLNIEFHREVDGRWIADIPALPGVTVYGRTRKQALTAVEVLALRLIADRLEHGEALPDDLSVSFAA